MKYRPSLVHDDAGIVRVEKAHAYVTHGARLLAFTHRDSAESGIQIPAGTVRAGESPEAAVLREVEEETGLTELVLVAPLGFHDSEADPLMVPPGHEHQRRHAFHVEVRGEVSDSWQHWERGDGDIVPIAFEFFWVPLREAPAVLAPFIGDQGISLLTRLRPGV